MYKYSSVDDEWSCEVGTYMFVQSLYHIQIVCCVRYNLYDYSE